MERNAMAEQAKRKRGVPNGNPSTRKQGFYIRVLDEAEKLDFQRATGVDGIDDEIALMRVKIKSLLAKDPENIRDIIAIANALERLVKTRYRITREQRKGLKEAIGNVLREVALPLGISVGADIIGKRLG
jgi:hypothetical protein